MACMTDDELQREFPGYPLATAREMEGDRRKGIGVDGREERTWKETQAASERNRQAYNRRYDLDDNGRPLKKGAAKLSPPLGFKHLGKAGTAVPVTTRADAGDDDDTDAQTPTIPCDMCEGSGSFGGGDCPACDGAGALTATQADDQAKDFVDQLKDVQARVQGRAPVGPDPTPTPGSVAAKVLQAGREADTSGRGKPKPGSFAAQVLAAGRKARGEG